LLQADLHAFFLTDHYRAYPWVLVRLPVVRHEVACKLLEDAWRRVAPPRIVATQFSGQHIAEWTHGPRPITRTAPDHTQEQCGAAPPNNAMQLTRGGWSRMGASSSATRSS
jgi:hypothetical protein